MDLKYLLVFWSLHCYKVFCQQFERHHQVFVAQGELQGVLYKFDEDHRVQMFYGVPYAQPPTGQLRFKKPEPIISWNGKKHADIDYGAPCIQFLGFHTYDKYSRQNMKKQSEDCLFLNIFAPYVRKSIKMRAIDGFWTFQGNKGLHKLSFEAGSIVEASVWHPETFPILRPYEFAAHDDKGRRHPVMVWIHGGSYLAGSGDTGMDKGAIIKNIVFRDIVLVTINYRLGPLGFLSYTDASGQRRGNFGLWDQVMALKWIHENIRHFNGDADSVTIIGESAGAASVSALALSPVTDGLVHKAIIMSGSISANWAVFRSNTTNPNWDIKNIMRYYTCEKRFESDIMTAILDEMEMDEYGECNLLSSKIYCPKEDSTELLGCLREHGNFTDTLFNKIISTENGVSKLVIDGELVVDKPEEMLKNYSRIPILIGIAESEWGHKEVTDYSFSQYEPVEKEIAQAKINAAVRNYALTLPQLPNTTLDLIANVTYFHYLQTTGQEPPYEQQMFVQLMRQIEADIDFVKPLHTEAQAYADNGNPVYVYVFEHVPQGDIVEDEIKTYDFFGEKRVIHINRTMQHSKAFHGLDHGYIFTRGYSGNYQVEDYGEEDERMANLISSLWTNFAHFSDPTPRLVGNVKWAAYTSEKPRYLHLKNPPFMEESEIGEDVVKYWDGLGMFLSNYAAIDDPTAARKSPLLDEERLELQAYKRAWWALWVLVAAIAIVLWVVVICMVGQKCCRADQTGPKPNPHFIVASSQI